MRIWRRRRQRPAPSDGAVVDEARAAREQAEELAARVRDRWSQVNAVAAGHERHQQENHFGALVRQALLRGG